MIKHIICACLIIGLSACSTTHNTFHKKQLKLVAESSQSNQSVVLWWVSYYKDIKQPISLAQKALFLDKDKVVREVNTNYSWNHNSKHLAELLSQGLNYKLHLRFMPSGEAVYQEYKDGDIVSALSSNDIEDVLNNLNLKLINIANLYANKQQMIQGFYQDGTLTKCDGTRLDLSLSQVENGSFVIIQAQASAAESIKDIKLIYKDIKRKRCFIAPNLLVK